MTANTPIIKVQRDVNGGRPSIEGIPTESVAERFRAGESISQLAVDYLMDHSDVEEALRFEMRFVERQNET